MNATADIVIVGGGIEGLACAYSLARRGSGRIVVVERDTIGSGGTGRSSGVVRCHYGISTLAAMAWRGLQFLERATDTLDDDVGFHQTGYVVGVAPVDADALRANVARLRDLGIETHDLTVADAARAFPFARLDDLAAFAYEPRGGFGDAYRTAQAFARASRPLGVQIHQALPVTAIRTAGDERVLGVDTTGGPIDASTVVVAAGAWSVPLLSAIGLHLPVRSQREQVLVVDPGGPLPPSPVLSDLGLLQYVRFEPTSEMVVGNSDHRDPEFIDPDQLAPRADPDFIERAVAKLAHRFPGLPDPRVRSTYAGSYDVTPDYNPVISLTGVSGLVVCAGFSGHGFKIAPAVGELVADLVHHRRSAHAGIDERDLTLQRFEDGALLTSPYPYAAAAQMR